MTVILAITAVGVVLAVALAVTVRLVLPPECRRRRQQRRRKRQYLRRGTAHLENPTSGDAWSGGGPTL